MDIGRRVREVREDLGMQRTVLARRVGVAENTIYRIETGKRTPSVEVLEKIARELRTEPAEFLREPVPLHEAPQVESGQAQEERVRDLAEVAQEALGHIETIYDQERRAAARVEASEGVPQTFFVEADQAILDLFAPLHRDAALQVLSMVGLELRHRIARLEREKAELEKALEKALEAKP